MTFTIIGAGMAGMVAAVCAAQNGNQVILLEHGDRVGRKILSTGNGRCNISNADMKVSHYHGKNPDYAREIIERFNDKDTEEFFFKLGLLLKNKNGYIYPYCEQASAVLDVLRYELERLSDRIKLVLNCNVDNIIKNSDFIVYTDKGVFESERLIIACGSKAAKKTGSDGSGYELARMFSHNIIKPLPALTSLLCKDKNLNTLAGIRTEAKVTLVINGEVAAYDTGELQINKDNLSGIPVFQVSYIAGIAIYEGKEVILSIDFLPGLSHKDVCALIKKRISYNGNIKVKEVLVGVLHKNISYVIAKKAGLATEELLYNMDDNKIEAMASLLKKYDFRIEGINSYDKAQVCSGGVATEELTNNLESKLVKGLYFAGEIIDINGDCGGYNLQWAISSGAICGGYDNA